MKKSNLFNSIRSKFGVPLLIVFIIISSILGVFNYYQSEKELERQVEEKMEATLTRLSLGLGKLLYNFYGDQVYQIITTEMNDKEVHSILIKDATNTYVTHGQTRNTDWNLVNISEDFQDTSEDLYHKEVTILFNSVGSDDSADDEIMGVAKVYVTKKFLRDKLTDLIITTVIESIVLFTVLYLAIYMILMIVIINPLQKLKTSSDELAKGNLSYDIETEREDEIGSLANSFEIMRDSIRKKISNLNTLNTTGEELSEFISSDNREQSKLYILSIIQKVLVDYLHLDSCKIFIWDEENKQFCKDFGEIKSIDTIMSNAIKHKQVEFAQDGDELRCCMPMVHEDSVIAIFDATGKEGTIQRQHIGNEFISTLFRMGITAILRVTMLGDIQRLNQDLEKRVKERTAELSVAQMQSEEARKKAEMSKDEAERANQAKSQFLSNMSHELRTPLNAVLGFSEMLKTQMHDSKSISYLTAINTAGNTLLALINSVLDLAKIESGKMELEYNPTSLKRLLNELYSFFYQQASERDILFEIQLSDDIEECVLLDTLKLKQVLINLCSNAVKFTRDGSVTVKVRTSASSNEAKVNIYIDIVDTGKGIPKSQQERIFHAFEQISGQKSSEYGGTGLGLAITLEIVHLMGGTINVSSEGENMGSCFSIMIPDVEKCSAELTEFATESSTIDFEEILFEPAKIMIVDDIPHNRNLISSYLSDWKFDILEAKHGQDALDKVHDFSPDLILTDLKMPVVDGQELCIKLREDMGSNCMPLVMVTASAMVEEQKDLLKVCNDLLTKPLAKQTLISCLLKHLEHSIVESSSNKDRSGDNIEYQDINLRLLPDDQRIALVEFVEIGDTENAIKLCVDLPSDLTNESKWLIEMLESFELAKILDRLNSIENPIS
ncbi:putative Signal transduction histidine kinase [Vibrio nigripulchritudo SO65]|uniref:ATP-binding protein n=1 Tax=Vibrio nigripulchritudo TaxID=28173 RepID=UPI0003B19787|nr:ATP-binding protein [Vibrio nigripulchritudo]CCN37793.1 putative Signal transduction histidine kinase [Vibrio nigripulchritudo AM115]CCN44783.1 putative Signal transduction histidine kinase [Vibrio nigripulchritudo FTn2]CCN62897.1 putative Signal transduction histidine kinase [Vibrio nigripulchritudo POn4]CCN77887.1 putative Signal transduction histidine kinase [Vibrio nigripulchritudo SO65]